MTRETRSWGAGAFVLAIGAVFSGVASGASANVAAQAGDIASRVVKLKDARTTVDERERLISELLAAGEPGVVALARCASDQLERAVKRADSLEPRYFDAFERATKKLVASRTTRAVLAEVDEARGAVRKLQSMAELSKADIEEHGDPAVTKLKEIFVVTTDQLLEFQPALAAQREELSNAWFAASEWHEAWARAASVLGDAKKLGDEVDPGPRWDAVPEQEEWLCILALPMTTGDRRALVNNRTLTDQLDPEEAAGVLDLNRLRLLLGLNALTIDLKLCNASRDHSNDMRTLGFFAHESPVEGKKTPWDRAARAGTSASSENIAAGQTKGSGANRAWWYSPGHHKNMLGGHSRIGLGRSETHWTQMFG